MLIPTVPHGEISTLVQFETNGPAHDGLLLKAYAQTPNSAWQEDRIPYLCK